MLKIFEDLKVTLPKSLIKYYPLDEVLNNLEYDESFSTFSKIDIIRYLNTKKELLFNNKKYLLSEIHMFYLIDLLSQEKIRQISFCPLDFKEMYYHLYEEMISIECANITRKKQKNKLLFFPYFNNILIEHIAGVSKFLIDIIEHAGDLSLFKYYCDSIEYNIGLIDSFYYNKELNINDLQNLMKDIKAHIIPISIKTLYNKEKNFKKEVQLLFNPLLQGTVTPVDELNDYLIYLYKYRESVYYFKLKKVHGKVVITDEDIECHEIIIK